MPAGPVTRSAANRMQDWLNWTLDLGFLRANPLEPAQLRRLVGSIPDVTAAQQALAAVMVDDLAQAEGLERQYQGDFDERWGPYLTLKARALLERGELESARLSLLRVGPSWERHPTYLAVGRSIAERRGDAPAVAAAEAALLELPAESWRGGQMNWRDGTARLEIVPGRPADGVLISILDLPDEGRPMRVFWNGSSRGTFIAYPNQPLRLEVEVRPEPSLLELRSADRRAFVPGPISLLDATQP